jgi:hypothetical protein
MLQFKGGNRSLTPAQIYSTLANTAIDMDNPSTVGFDVGFDFGTGSGLIIASSALKALAPLPSAPIPQTPVPVPPPQAPVPVPTLKKQVPVATPKAPIPAPNAPVPAPRAQVPAPKAPVPNVPVPLSAGGWVSSWVCAACNNDLPKNVDPTENSASSILPKLHRTR